jgi:hypothetical protein
MDAADAAPIYERAQPTRDHGEGRSAMTNRWDYQIRIYLADEVAETARRDPGNPALKPLTDVLTKHHATMKCQYDAFAGYVAEAEANGTGNYPLYAWTKATIETPAKKEKYTKSFTLYVDGREVYGKATAEALETDLQPLVGGDLITRMSKHDTNPANNPQPPAQYRQ